ncbi:MAG: hypothetical protein U9N87_00035 [Planctomycetota bacterium]|nr:hypothetical protein [Planctomycetota bacterium]
MDRANISPLAEISGASYLTGSRCVVGPGAVVRDARLHDAVVEAGAVVVDSIVVAEGEPKSHRCDTAGRTVVAGAEQPRIAAGSEVRGSTLINVSVESGTKIVDTCAHDCRFGRDNAIENAKLTLVDTASRVRVAGPTEVSEAWLGNCATIDRRGYFEGLFSNKFHRLEYDKREKRLRIIETIELPHVSRYGTNTINSTNSGKLLPQTDGRLGGFGAYGGLWHDPLLSHEQLELAPCCWIAPWTKVVGQSAAAHHADEQLVNDKLTTYMMPFAMAGVGGDLTRGLVMPGELSLGLGYKQRRGAWVFSYAPGAVIAMVGRLHDALETDRKTIADTIVVASLRTALAMVESMADAGGIDLDSPTDRQKKAGRSRWILATHKLLKAHLDADLWRFEAGRPCQWHKQGDRWTHPRFERVTVLVPDALEKQVAEEEIFDVKDPIRPASVALPAGAVNGTGGRPLIDPDARISPQAHIGPGCRIGPGTVVEAGASVWNSALGGCRVQEDTRIERSRLNNTEVGCGSVVRSCVIDDSRLGEHMAAYAASMKNTHLAARATVAPFADLVDVKTSQGVILGGSFASTDINTVLMSMHIAGDCTHLQALPTTIQLDGRQVEVPAVPMLGAGAQIRGTLHAPVRMECCFIGSNAVLEAGTYVGFGSFVLGRLESNMGLPPFTIADGDSSRHKIGGVPVAMPSTIITHFINWTFQALGPEQAQSVAELARQALARGAEAVEWELARREGKAKTDGKRFACYRSLSEYSEQQLAAGLLNYRRALESGAWDIEHKDGQLWFASEKGHWLERDGSAFWEKEDS